MLRHLLVGTFSLLLAFPAQAGIFFPESQWQSGKPLSSIFNGASSKSGVLLYNWISPGLTHAFLGDPQRASDWQIHSWLPLSAIVSGGLITTALQKPNSGGTFLFKEPFHPQNAVYYGALIYLVYAPILYFATIGDGNNMLNDMQRLTIDDIKHW